jgi:hypothetical protein
MKNITSEKIRYSVPMSLWFVELNQRWKKRLRACAWSSWWSAWAS